MRKIKLTPSQQVMLIAVLGLVGCGTMVKDKQPDPMDFCLVAKAIYIDNDDVLTDKTAEQIYTHDCTGQRLCGWGGKRAAEVCSRKPLQEK